MSQPYLSRRTGSTQWMMQRVSAALLIVLAFTHFAIQHFTSDAVSTGLTVARRINDPWWQGYYIIFIVLVLYHGINGLVGIVRDYSPKPILRLGIEILQWSVAGFFAVRGIINIASPAMSVNEAKIQYATHGFPEGKSPGNPPSFAESFDFRTELRELYLMEYYLVKQTHRTEDEPVATVFGHQDGAPTTENIARSGEAFDAWINRVLAHPELGTLDHHALFSSSYEFAVWAKDVRRRDAAERQRLSTVAGDRARDEAILARLPEAPAYQPTELN